MRETVQFVAIDHSFTEVCRLIHFLGIADYICGPAVEPGIPREWWKMEP